MRIEASGVMRRIDVDLLARVAAALHVEWTNLQFDQDGLVINPETSAAIDSLRLTNGRHGSKRARYLVAIESPEVVLRPVQEEQGKFQWSDGPSAKRSQRKAPHPVPVGTTTTTVWMRPTSIATNKLMFEMADAVNETWKGELSIDHTEALKLTAAGRSKMTTLAQSTGETPHRLVTWLIRGPAKVEVAIDLTPLKTHTSGQVATVKGRLGRYPIQAIVTHTPKTEASKITTVTNISAKGSGRLLLLLSHRWLRRSVAKSLDAMHLPESLDRLGDGLAELSEAVALAGGAESYVHEELWVASDDSGSEPSD